MHRNNIFGKKFRNPVRRMDIRHFFSCFRYAKQRMDRGYADCDLWDLSEYLLRIFETSLRDFADMLSPENEIHSYPERYGSMENWVAELIRISAIVSEIRQPFFISDRREAEEEFAGWLRDNIFDLWD